MVALHLLNFVMHNFLQAGTKALVVFNCWDVETFFTFSKMTTDQNMYTQFVNLNSNDSVRDLEHRFFVRKCPILGVFLDMNCRMSEELLNVSSRYRYYNDHYHWLLYDHQANLTKLHALFIHANISVNADVTYAALNPSRLNTSSSSYLLFDVHSNGNHLGGKLNITADREIECDDGACDVGRYLSTLHKRSKYDNRNRLSDITMRIATVVTQRPVDWPHELLQNFLRGDNESASDAISRLGFKMIMLIQDMLQCNMSYRYFDLWSIKEVEGAALGAMRHERSELVSTPFLVTNGRLEHFTPVVASNAFHSVCIFRTPRAYSGIHGQVFLEPFDVVVWIIFCLILVLCAALLWSTFVVECRSLRLCFGCVPSFLGTCLIAFGSACSQGSDIIPLSLGGRMAFLSLSLITFIMYNYYTSAVVSSLLGSPVKSNIKTMGQLADSPLEVKLEPIPFHWVFLNTTQLPDVRRFVRRKIELSKNPDELWISAVEGVIRVRDDPGFVFVFEASSGFPLIEKYFTQEEICDLNEVLLRSESTIHTQIHKNSTYKELLKIRQLRTLETGVYIKHRDYWIHTKLNCYATNLLIDVGLEYTAPLFILMLTTYALCLIILVFEITYHRYIDRGLELFFKYIEG